ncbi:MAG: hypothetical protein OEM61_10035 [Desulfobacteraceae bacterium]|jgi:predicted ABC-type ATPase|nr:hypothetical protein [Desulfobacteraceae bacterium]MDH3567676.1 hypothetical protein [Desulfobacteraceae bacterium]
MDFEIRMARLIAERLGKRRNPWNYAGADSSSLETVSKQAVLIKSHGKTQGKFFMGEKIEAKTKIEAIEQAAHRGFSVFFVVL